MTGPNLPRWYSVLPVHIRPDHEKVEPLESLRISLQMRDELFMVALASSPWAVVRSQEATLESLRQQIPDADERKLWTAVMLTRLEIKLNSPAPWDPPPEEIRRRMDNVQEIMRDFSSWNEVLDYILDMDRTGTVADPASPQYQINAVLAQ